MRRGTACIERHSAVARDCVRFCVLAFCWAREGTVPISTRNASASLRLRVRELEIVDVARGIEGKRETWQPPTVRFAPPPPSAPVR